MEKVTSIVGGVVAFCGGLAIGHLLKKKKLNNKPAEPEEQEEPEKTEEEEDIPKPIGKKPFCILLSEADCDAQERYPEFDVVNLDYLSSYDIFVGENPFQSSTKLVLSTEYEISAFLGDEVYDAIPKEDQFWVIDEESKTIYKVNVIG